MGGDAVRLRQWLLQIRNGPFYKSDMIEPDWEALRTFNLVAKTGSMAAAADQIGCAVSTVARRIDGLEQTLGLAVLHRARAGAVPTDVGASILANIEQAAQSLNQIPRQARHFLSFADRRTIKMSATETVINDILMPNVGKLRAAYHNLLLEFDSSNTQISLEFGQADLAIRLSQPTLQELIIKKLAPIRIEVFINPDQLGDRDPLALSLQNENLVWIDSGLGDIAENRLIDQLGISDQIVLRANSVRALAMACKAGQGLAMLPAYMGHDLGLVALPHINVPDRQAWLVHHPDTRRDPLLRAARRWVVDCFDAMAAQ